MLQHDSTSRSEHSNERHSSTKRFATALSVIGAAFIFSVGVAYVLVPQSMARNFGLPVAPGATADGFLNVKGVRDMVTGLIIVGLLLVGQRRALAVATLTIALIPTGDMLTILTRHGSIATALGVHGVTAALVAATGLLLLNERSVRA